MISVQVNISDNIKVISAFSSVNAGPACAAATYDIKDSGANTLYSGSVASGDNLDQTIQDSTVNVRKSDNTLISAVSVLAEGTEDELISDSRVIIEKGDNTVIEVVQVMANSTKNTQIPDSPITVNGNEFGSVKATDSLDVPVQYENGTPVGTIVGGVVEITDPIVPSGIAYQRPISTGRLTSFRDGDYGYHRALGTYNYTPPTNPIHIAELNWAATSPFITLKDNNVFGNKSRFTDQFGNEPGSFVNDYIIDHLTGLAWKRVLSGAVTWNDAIDAAQIEVFEGESGWRVSSIDEAHSILDYTNFDTLNYSPMGALFHSNNQWTSVAQSGTNAYYHNPVHGNIGFTGITGIARFLLCRNHFN